VPRSAREFKGEQFVQIWTKSEVVTSSNGVSVGLSGGAHDRTGLTVSSDEPESNIGEDVEHEKQHFDGPDLVINACSEHGR
jgi:hypothetical protein